MNLFGKSNLFAPLQTVDGAVNLTIVMILVLALLVVSVILKLPVLQVLHKFTTWVIRKVGKIISKKEKAYHRDLEIGRITEQRTKYKLYKFLSELIIDLGMSNSGITPYELLTITTVVVIVVTGIVCQLLFGNAFLTIAMGPIATVGTFCAMYTRANIAHDTRIEAVIEAENIICNTIKVGVLVAVRESLDVIPKTVRPDFKTFVDNVEQKNYHIKTALLELNQSLGSVADDFIKKCIVFELEEEHGIAGMFADIVEINNINMEMRTNMKRKFEEVKTNFIIGASMIFVFLFGVLAIFEDVRVFYLTTAIGQIIMAIDLLLLILEFVYITYLRAQEL